MSREERLFDAIGGVDESLLKRSEKTGPRRISWLEWGVGLAACLAVVLTAAWVLPGALGEEPPVSPVGDYPPDSQQAPEDPQPTQQPPNSSAVQPWTASWASEDGEMHYLRVLTGSGEPEVRFRIYINKNIYYSYEQEGVYTVCPYQEPDGTPLCRLEISHMAGATVDEALERTMTGLTGLYAEIEALPGPPNGWYEVNEETDRFLFASDGIGWDAAQREVLITPDGEGGAFILSSSYFMEATEGHGARFADMIHTFMPEGVYGQTSVWLAELYDVGERLAEAVFSQDLGSVEDLLAPGAEVSGYVEDVSGWVTVSSIDCSYIPGDPSEETLAGRISVRHRLDLEDSCNYLTMELKKTGDQWKATRIGLEN